MIASRPNSITVKVVKVQVFETEPNLSNDSYNSSLITQLRKKAMSTFVKSEDD